MLNAIDWRSSRWFACLILLVPLIPLHRGSAQVCPGGGSTRFETFVIPDLGQNPIQTDEDHLITSKDGDLHILRFDGQAWIEVQVLDLEVANQRAPLPGSYDIDVSEGRILVRTRDENLTFVVKEFLFDGVSWNEASTLETLSLGSFGHEVDLDGNRALINGFSECFAFEHDGTSWVHTQTIDAFGLNMWNAVELEGDWAILGIQSVPPTFPDPKQSSGTVEFYRHDGMQWTLAQRSFGCSFSGAGSALDLSGNGLFVGHGNLWPCDRWAFRYDESTGSWDPVPGLPPHGSFPNLSVGATNGTFFAPSSECIWKIDGESEPVVRHSLPPSLGGSMEMEGDILFITQSLGADQAQILVYHGIGKTPQAGTVDLAGGGPSNVLFVNGSPGGGGRVVTLPVSTPITVELFSSPAALGGPGDYLLWAWRGPEPQVAYPVGTSAETIGWFRTRPPFLLGTSRGTLPIRCVRSPSFAFLDCGGIQELGNSPAATPWSVTKSGGIQNPTTFSLQAMVEDPGAANSMGISVSNAIFLIISP